MRPRFEQISKLRVRYSLTHMSSELVTTLQRQSTELLPDIKPGNEPMLSTPNDGPSAHGIAVDTSGFCHQRLALHEGIARGEKAIAEGAEIPHVEAKARMARWLK